MTLSIKIANKDRHKMYNATCRLIYSYYLTDYSSYNRETNLTDSIPNIDRTYRFSFDLIKFPSKFLRTYLSKDSVNYQNDRILVIVSGEYGGFGEAFLIEKQYGFKDIEIAKDTEQLYEYRQNEDGKVESTKVNYSNLDKVKPYTEDEIERIKEAIRRLIEQKQKAETLRLQSLLIGEKPACEFQTNEPLDPPGDGNESPYN